MKLAIADPPYPGQSKLYRDHPDYAGEVDHAELVARLEADYGGWALHTSSSGLGEVLAVCPPGVRVGAWVKSWCAWKSNVTVAYAWEPVIFKPGRPRPRHLPTLRDWIDCPMEMKKGLTGAKPALVCRWVFDLLGAEPNDELDDLFPGTGAIASAWEGWKVERPFVAMDYTGMGAGHESTMGLLDASE